MEFGVGGNQWPANDFSAGEIKAIISGMIEQEGKLERPLIEERGRVENRRAMADRPGDIHGLAFPDLANPSFLPRDIGDFRSEQIGSVECVGAIEQAKRLLVQCFTDEPFDGDASIDDENHRRRSRRSNTVLSVCGRLGVIAAIRSA
jgi:hypothetical protein